MGKYLELFRGEVGDLTEKTKLENKPYVAYSTKEGRVVYTEIIKPQPLDEIWYTTLYGNTINYKGYEYKVISNTYESGKGIIKFNEPLTISKLCGWPNSGSGGEGGSFENAANSYYSPANDELITLSLPNVKSDSILYRTFADNKYLRQINIPEGISVLGAYVFQGCESLESITIPSTVKEFGETLPFEINPETQEVRPTYMCSTFDGCYFTKEKFINKSSLDAEANNYWGATIVDSDENGVLMKDNIILKIRPYYKSTMTNYKFPEFCQETSDRLFENITSLSSVDLSNVTTIGNSSFSGCTSLSSVDLSNVTTIGSGSFNRCSSLEHVTIDYSKINLTGNPFENTPYYSQYYNSQNDGVIVLGNVACDYKGEINDNINLIFPDNITCISNKVKDSILSQSSDCVNYIEIPSSVKCLIGNVFYYLPSFGESTKEDPKVVFGGTVAEWESMGGHNAFYCVGGYVKCSDGYSKIEFII